MTENQKHKWLNETESIYNHFPYEYTSDGYYRQKNVPSGEKSSIIHGEEAIKLAIEFAITMVTVGVRLDDILKNKKDEFSLEV